MDAVSRAATITRTTRETDIRVSVGLDGPRESEISTGLGFLDHMLTSLAFWSGFELRVDCSGDLEVDDHHTVEDVALTIGQAVDRALGDRVGLERFGSAYAPMDEALVRAIVDLSGRAYAVTNLGFEREKLGAVATENLTHWFRSFATAARATLHVDLIRGENDHHKAEAAYKALGLALRDAVTRTTNGVPSTKGRL